MGGEIWNDRGNVDKCGINVVCGPVWRREAQGFWDYFFWVLMIFLAKGRKRWSIDRVVWWSVDPLRLGIFRKDIFPSGRVGMVKVLLQIGKSESVGTKHRGKKWVPKIRRKRFSQNAKRLWGWTGHPLQMGGVRPIRFKKDACNLPIGPQHTHGNWRLRFIVGAGKKDWPFHLEGIMLDIPI